MLKYKTLLYATPFIYLVVIRNKQTLNHRIRTNLQIPPENLSQISLMITIVWADLSAAQDMREQSPAECLGKTQVMHRLHDGSMQEM